MQKCSRRASGASHLPALTALCRTEQGCSSALSVTQPMQHAPAHAWSLQNAVALLMEWKQAERNFVRFLFFKMESIKYSKRLAEAVAQLSQAHAILSNAVALMTAVPIAQRNWPGAEPQLHAVAAEPQAGNPVLHRASEQDHTVAAQLLRGRGANVDAANQASAGWLTH
jgi:hypothetical protein